MEKWADYCISKITFTEDEKRIYELEVYEDSGKNLINPKIIGRDELVSNLGQGNTYVQVTKNNEGKWAKLNPIFLNKYGTGNDTSEKLPRVLTRRKTFLSYYHIDQTHKDLYLNLFGDLIINKSVDKDDIDSENSADYVKQLINQKYLDDTTVLIVLIGPKTYCRKHIDWEISGGLDHKVGDKHAALIGILLPNHPDYNKEQYEYKNLPQRLSENVKKKYAKIYKWTYDRILMQGIIEDAFQNRVKNEDLIVNRELTQMQRNLCD